VILALSERQDLRVLQVKLVALEVLVQQVLLVLQVKLVALGALAPMERQAQRVIRGLKVSRATLVLRVLRVILVLKE
jgi:hypothetical protein